jgi:hypothetical protein
VGEDVALGVPVGLLRRAAQGGHLREMPIQPVSSRTSIPREGRTDWTAHLSHSPQTRSGGSSAKAGAISRQSAAVSGARREVEARGQLEGAQDPQRVVGERRARVAQDAGPQVALAAEGVDDGAREGVDRDRVHREVAPGRRVGVAEAGSGATANPRWPAPVFDSRRGRLKSYSDPPAPRTLMTPKLRPTTSVAPKGRAPRLRPSKSTPADLDVEILGSPPEEPVAHAPADEPRAPPRRGARPRASRAGPREGGGPSICASWSRGQSGEGRRRGQDPARDEAPGRRAASPGPSQRGPPRARA